MIEKDSRFAIEPHFVAGMKPRRFVNEAALGSVEQEPVELLVARPGDDALDQQADEAVSMLDGGKRRLSRHGAETGRLAACAPRVKA